jgi:hypothetical protein
MRILTAQGTSTSTQSSQLGDVTPSQPWQHPEYPALGTGEVDVNA